MKVPQADLHINRTVTTLKLIITPVALTIATPEK